MEPIRVSLRHPHRLGPEEARAAIERFFDVFARRYPGYRLRHAWKDEARTRVEFSFEKPARGNGSGTATLEKDCVELRLDALYDLPFFVPVAVAEWRVRTEMGEVLRESFG